MGKLNNFCQKISPADDSLLNEFRTLGVEEKIMRAVRYWAKHSTSLLENDNMNNIEQFYGIIAQKIGGKRGNFSLRRCFSAVDSRNARPPLYNIRNHLTGGHTRGNMYQKLKWERKIYRSKSMVVLQNQNKENKVMTKEKGDEKSKGLRSCNMNF